MSTEPTFNGRVISDEEFEAMADDVVANPPTFTGEPRRRGERPSLGDGPSRSVQARRSPEPTFDGRPGATFSGGLRSGAQRSSVEEQNAQRVRAPGGH